MLGGLSRLPFLTWRKISVVRTSSCRQHCLLLIASPLASVLTPLAMVITLPSCARISNPPVLAARERHQHRPLCPFVQITPLERSSVVATEAGNASTRIHLGVADRSRLC